MSDNSASRGFTGRPRAPDNGRVPGNPVSVDAEMLAEVGWSAAERPRLYVCGPTAFVEVVASACVTLGLAPERLRTERFGATGA